MWKLRLQSGESQWERDKWRSGGWALVFTDQDSHNYCDNGHKPEASIYHHPSKSWESVNDASDSSVQWKTGEVFIYHWQPYIKTDRAYSFKIETNREVPKKLHSIVWPAGTAKMVAKQNMKAEILSTKFKSSQTGSKQTVKKNFGLV